VLRGKREYKYAIAEDLEKWHGIVTHQERIGGLLEDECVKCGGVAVEWDRDAVPWCQKHWDVWKSQWEKERKRWDMVVMQLTLG
jgi:hypothetical protein